MYIFFSKLAKALGGQKAKDWFQRHQSENYLRYYIPYAQKKTDWPEVFLEGDAVRRGSLFLAARTLKREDIVGAFAELGVYRGVTSRLIHLLDPTRKMYLFDTFTGFDERDAAGENDRRFTDTDADAVLAYMDANEQVEVRAGWFPETAQGLEDEQFALVSLDVDKEAPTLAGLAYFYPRLSPGGYLFVHDYNSPESDFGVSKAIHAFMADKPEAPLEIPDLNGSIVIRRQRASS